MPHLITVPIAEAVLEGISSEEQSNWQDPVTPGKHPAKIIEVNIGEHNEGYDVVTLRLEVLDAAISPHTEIKSYQLKSNKARKFMQGEFAKIGIEIKNRADLLNSQEKLLGMELMINVQYPSGSPVIYLVGPSSSKSAPASDVWAD